MCKSIVLSEKRHEDDLVINAVLHEEDMPLRFLQYVYNGGNILFVMYTDKGICFEDVLNNFKQYVVNDYGEQVYNKLTDILLTDGEEKWGIAL